MRRASRDVNGGLGAPTRFVAAVIMRRTRSACLDGDKIVGGGKAFEVQPTTSEKVFRQITQTMTRIHAKQVG